MKQEFWSNTERLAWEQSEEAGWIDSASGPLFCCFHPPRGPAQRRAVLLCETLGSERMNLHLAYRHLALRLSYAGYPTLRFDYAGTGDSSGSPRDPDWAENWISGLNSASDYLLGRSGAKNLALFGARFGGTLAAHFAASRPDVNALLLWGPYLSGSAFLRSERALHQIVNANEAALTPKCAQTGDREFIGFLYNAAARERMESIRLLDIKDQICRDARIIAWDQDSPEDQLASHLSASGAHVQFDRPVGLISEDSVTEQAVPDILIREAIRWLDKVENSAGRSARKQTETLPLRPVAAVSRAATNRTKITEEVVRFDKDRGLFGVLTHGAVTVKDMQGVSLLLVNGGNNHRAGINRNHVEWARDAALRGVTTLRFDIRGLGDSAPLRPHDLNRLYRNDTNKDLRSAIDLLESRGRGNLIMVCGLCAGAFQALHAARFDSRVSALVLLDLLRWDTRASLVANAGFLARRQRNLGRTWRSIRRFLGMSPKQARAVEQLGDWLCKLTQRKVDIVCVGRASGDGFERFRDAIEPVRQELEASGRFRHEMLASTDHIFSPIWAQERLSEILQESLFKLSEGFDLKSRT